MKKARTKDAQIKLSEKVGVENALRLPLILNSPGIFTSNLARKFPASSCLSPKDTKNYLFRVIKIMLAKYIKRTT